MDMIYWITAGNQGNCHFFFFLLIVSYYYEQ